MEKEKYTINEYINPYFPDTQMYSCKIGDSTYHTDDYDKLVAWANDKIDNAEYYAELKKQSDKACALFMEDVKYKD